MEEDSLQADVMRFMAIVAFCLIAVLAMVRNSPGVEKVIEPQQSAVYVLSDPRPEPERQPEPVPEPEPEPEPTPTPTPTPTQEPEPEPPAAPSDTTKGLTLAFASEADFMRLISKGRITLYAYAGRSFLTTSDTYSFHSTKPPQQFYEIDKQTIPSHVLEAADLQEKADLQWGVGLSPRIEKQISQYIEANVNGQLHIDRYEQVQHVEAG
ncbi:MAG: hypothetical protein NXH95_06910 [Pseudomonadaceae bacterium]|nr:hypothetical protein [Pseudomonadaceae bacterium]